MKIVLAPDKYKSNMTSPEVCEVIADAFRSVIPDVQIVSLPMADGGDGTTRAMAAASGAELRTVEVTGPLGGKVLAEYAFHPQKKIGVMEMASASGIALVKAEELNPLRATTYGTGEVLKALLDDGAEQITIGIGGSATVDGGAGMAQALGYKLLDAEDNELATGAAELAKLARIDASGADPRLKNVRIDVACDVTSPLLGKTGAATVFGPLVQLGRRGLLCWHRPLDRRPCGRHLGAGQGITLFEIDDRRIRRWPRYALYRHRRADVSLDSLAEQQLGGT